MTAQLVVLGFDRLDQAREAWSLGRRLRRHRRLDVADAALAWRDPSGRVSRCQAVSPVRMAALGGACCGTLVGAVFLAPVVGLGIGAGIGALAGRFTGPGVDDDLVRRVAGYLQPGRAAIFVLVRRSVDDEVVTALRPYRPTVILTTLPPERELALVRELREVPAEV